MNVDADIFEHLLVHKCITSELYLNTVIESLNPAFFTIADVATVIGNIVTLYNDGHKRLTIGDLKLRLIASSQKDALKRVLKRISTLDTDIDTDKFIALTEEFIKEQSVFTTLKQVVNDIGNKPVDPSAIYQKFQKACSVSLTHNLGIDVGRDSTTVLQDLSAKVLRISTGWKWMDHYLSGGYQAHGRAMYIFAGETNVGKSIALGNVATNIARQGKHVLIVTLEMPESMYAQRIYANLTKIPVNEIGERSAEVEAKMAVFREGNGSIKVKEFPPCSLTVNGLRAFLSRYKSRGFKFDAVVVDYINLLAATQGDTSYERVKYISEQLRALTYEFGCPFISATQLNRAGYNTAEPGIETISESIGLAATADVVVSLWQDKTDKEMGLLKMGFAKNRFGSKNTTNTFVVDYKTMSITEDTRVSNTDQCNSSSDTLARLTKI